MFFYRIVGEDSCDAAYTTKRIGERIGIATTAITTTIATTDIYLGA
jgi:hypothetical protein